MSLIGRFLTNEYTVKRMGCGSYVQGEFVPGTLETLQVMGSMQPLNPRELKMVEEGTRIRQYFKFYTDQPLMVASERSLANSDKISVNGDWYKAMSVEPWQGIHVDLPYYKTIIYREPEQSSDGKGPMGGLE
jgi:hypothetical protein